MQMLATKDLQAGDLLLKAQNDAKVSRAIEFLQSVAGGKNTSIVHAGVLFDRNIVIEAQLKGISANDLRVQNRPYGYIVFRCKRPAIAAGAATFAKMMFDIQSEHENLSYTVPGALRSLVGGSGQAQTTTQLDDQLTRILAGKTQRFFCSQFVVHVFQFVAEQNGLQARQLFDASDAKVEPSELAGILSNHAEFDEVGYLLPGHR